MISAGKLDVTSSKKTGHSVSELKFHKFETVKANASKDALWNGQKTVHLYIFRRTESSVLDIYVITEGFPKPVHWIRISKIDLHQ